MFKRPKSDINEDVTLSSDILELIARAEEDQKDQKKEKKEDEKK